MKKIRISASLNIFLVFFAIILTACGNDDTYTVKATVSDGSDATYRVITHTPDGPVMKMLATRGGIFEMKDTLDVPTLVEVLANDYTQLGLYWAEKGAELEITIDPSGPGGFKVTGTEINDRLDKWLSDNKKLVAGGPSSELNEAIEKYVTDNKSDIVSTLLMITKWDGTVDPAKTLSLWNSIARDARPSHLGRDIITMAESATVPGSKGVLSAMSFYNQDDSLEYFVPDKHRVSIIAFSDENVRQAHDSITSRFDRLRKTYPSEDKMKIIDYSLDTDVRAWRAATFVDTADYTRAWSGPGHAAIGVAELAIGSLPFFIVTDSTGTQVYRGNSLSDAVTKATDLTK